MTAAERHLEWRYGPDWVTVVHVIETVRAATPDQLADLAGAARDAARDAAKTAAKTAARDAAKTAARDAAKTAAWDAAKTAAWDAAWDAPKTAAKTAARDAVWAAAWAAAKDAARAAVVFDLIGQHGYTRAHHDLLTQPYRQEFGDPWENR